MNLINKKVTHKLFGMGSIVKQNDSSIEIHFGSENKKFVFPDVFGKHLKLHDKSDANSLEKLIQKKELERKEEEWKKEEEKKLQRNTGIHESQATGTNGSHRRRAVRLEDVAHDAHGVGEVVGQHALEGAVCQVAVTNLAAAHATGSTCLASREAGEVIVEQETLVLVLEHIVDEFLVEFCTKGNCSESLSLTASEHC